MKENIENEIWKPIVGFEKHYEVSNMGNIRRLGKTKIRLINYAQIYPTMLLSVNGKHKTYRVHRLVAEAFLPKDIFRTHVNHINGDKTDNRAANLEWVTPAENSQHAWAKGLNKRTESNTEAIMISRSNPVIDTSTGTIYRSVRLAARFYGIGYGTLLNKLNGKCQNNTTLIYNP